MARSLIRVVAGLIFHQDRWLVAKKKSDGQVVGRWEFPGGKIEPNETPEKALEREIQEELNLKVKVLRVLTSSRFQTSSHEIELIGVLAESESEKFELVEHESARWCRLAEIDDLDLVEADRPLLSALVAYGNKQGSID